VAAEVIPPPKSVGEDNSEHQNNVPMDEDPSSQAGLIADPQGGTIAGGVEP
ncbi:unnamed protein product, partial [Arabidopsis halleri]